VYSVIVEHSQNKKVKVTLMNKSHSPRRRYTLQHATTPSKAQDTVFLTMNNRKLQRDLNGTQKKETTKHLIALFILLLLIYGVGASSFENGAFTTTLTIKLWQIVVVGFWFLFCVVLLSVFSDSLFFSALIWMFVYWPLLAAVVALLFTGSSQFLSAEWILVFFVIAEVWTFLITISVHYLYPAFIRSYWFRDHLGATRYWDIQLISGWNMTYSGKYGFARYTCKYEGEFDELGLPSGSGRWSDDSHGGEILTGKWKDGKPVAPFLSRQYGTGDAFRATPVAYFMATDDEFGFNKLIPSNTKPARCGVATVECSVQGAFYKNLPAVSELFGPEDKESLSECFRYMVHLAVEQRNHVEINASDPRGIEVLGRVYAPTGLPFTDEPNEIVVNVQREVEKSSIDENDDFMPPSSRRRLSTQEYVLIRDQPKSSGEPFLGQNSNTNSENVDGEADKQAIVDNKLQEEQAGTPETFAHLEVQNWISSPHKEALVFLPGFNSCLEKSLQNFGQFMAMTKILEHAYPIIFAWPNGQVLTYRHASAISASDRNKELFLQLMRGLSTAGIRHIHFLTHSLGVQTLLSSFGDKVDGSRSDVSHCFQLEQSFADGTFGEELMVCKSITMVNPDFPVEAFVEHSFLSIRRVCNHITVVGDQCDQALFYSQFINGLCNYWGYEQPSILGKYETEKSDKRRKFQYQRVIGRDIKTLYLPDTEQHFSDDLEKQAASDPRLLFKGVPPILLSSDKHPHDHAWLDVDVIDTTQLDTNIKGLRHSGFNVNPILLNDLEELIFTGRRAANRSTLLFREGNIYSYCHAPSFVTM
jgi:hypothetical protein